MLIRLKPAAKRGRYGTPRGVFERGKYKRVDNRLGQYLLTLEGTVGKSRALLFEVDPDNAGLPQSNVIIVGAGKKEAVPGSFTRKTSAQAWWKANGDGKPMNKRWSLKRMNAACLERQVGAVKGSEPETATGAAPDPAVEAEGTDEVGAEV